MTEFSFLTTPYQGFEDEVLRLRNRNRPVPQSRSYLDWRYLGQKPKSSPEIFWIQTSEGAFVGMASLIYRPYWLGNIQYEFMVFGDISLDREYRGSGLADNFFLFIQGQIQQKTAPCALVIPNIAAGKVLGRCGWHEKDRLVHHVLLLNPEKKIAARVKIKGASYILSKMYLLFLEIKCMAVRADGLVVTHVPEFKEEFDTFWELYSKKNICTRDRSRRSLQWRYRDHPGGDFSIATCHLNGNFIAYCIYAVNVEGKTITVYDLMVMEAKYICGFMKLFVNFIKENIQVDSIRIVLNGGHPYCRYLKKIGFSARKGGQQVQILVPNNAEVSLRGYKWALTAGDKDV